MTTFSSALHPVEETLDERGPAAEHRPGAAGRASALPARASCRHRRAPRARRALSAAPVAPAVPHRRRERARLPAGLPARRGAVAADAPPRPVAVRKPAHARRPLPGLGVVPDRWFERSAALPDPRASRGGDVAGVLSHRGEARVVALAATAVRLLRRTRRDP